MRYGIASLLLVACGSDVTPIVPEDAPSSVIDTRPPEEADAPSPIDAPAATPVTISLTGERAQELTASVSVTENMNESTTTITLKGVVIPPFRTVGFSITIDGAPSVQAYPMPITVAAGVATDSPAQWRMTLAPTFGTFSDFTIASAEPIAQGGTPRSWMIHGSGHVTLMPDEPDQGNATATIDMALSF